jgi:hypothetical protein
MDFAEIRAMTSANSEIRLDLPPQYSPSLPGIYPPQTEAKTYEWRSPACRPAKLMRFRISREAPHQSYWRHHKAKTLSSHYPAGHSASHLFQLPKGRSGSVSHRSYARKVTPCVRRRPEAFVVVRWRFAELQPLSEKDSISSRLPVAALFRSPGTEGSAKRRTQYSTNSAASPRSKRGLRSSPTTLLSIVACSHRPARIPQILADFLNCGDSAFFCSMPRPAR